MGKLVCPCKVLQYTENTDKQSLSMPPRRLAKKSPKDGLLLRSDLTCDVKKVDSHSNKKVLSLLLLKASVDFDCANVIS
jgi:hypothetical protein